MESGENELDRGVAWWVTPSGTTVSLDHGTEYTRGGHAAVFIDLNVGSNRLPVCGGYAVSRY